MMTIRAMGWKFPIVTIVAMVSLCGCGGDKATLPKAPVSGTVTYTKPFPQGEVIFKHAAGEITVAKFQADGKYSAQVPQGKNTVMVRSQTSSVTANARPGAQMEIFTNHIPARYGDFTTSKLELDVVDGTNKLDIALTD